MKDRLCKTFVVLYHVPYLIAIVLSLPIISLIHPDRIDLQGGSLREVRFKDKTNDS